MLLKCSARDLNKLQLKLNSLKLKCNNVLWSKNIGTLGTQLSVSWHWRHSYLLHRQSAIINSKLLDLQTRTQENCLNIKSLSFLHVVKKFFSKMDDPKRLGIFCGQVDRFNGITVDSAEEYEENVDFEQKLKKSIEYWIKNKKRGIWFKVRTVHSEWIQILTKNDFEFHYAKKGFVVLYRWLPKHEEVNLPDYSHTMVGVGGLVINHDKMEVLVITDRYAAIPGSWKLPGGYVEPGENLVAAAIREVKEETGIDSVFRTMISLRHSHGGSFGCSDLYFVVGLSAINLDIKPCEREIARAQWMPIAEYLQHPQVHETNRHFLRTYLDYERRGLRFDCLSAKHQILKKDYQVFYTRALQEHEKIKIPESFEYEHTDVPKKE